MYKLELREVKEFVQLKHPNGQWVKMDGICGRIVERSDKEFEKVPKAYSGITRPPVIDIESFTFEDSGYIRENVEWKAETLYKAAEKQKCKVFDLPLAGIDLTVCGFKINSKCACDVAQHMLRIINTDLDIPIILDDGGYPCDGWHRIIKALIEGRRTVKAMRLKHMPNPDRTLSEEGGK